MWSAIEELIKRGEERGEENGARKVQNADITKIIQYLRQDNASNESIVQMLTNIFELSSEEAMKRIQEVAKA